MDNPLLETAPVQIKLTSAPLERVLAAIAFSPVLRIGDESGAGIADFQEEVRARYPALAFEQEHAVQVQLGPDGSVTPSLSKKPVWRLFDKERAWRVSLTPESIALETERDYRNRDDFVERLSFLTQAVARAFEPAEITRVGFRYLNVFGPSKLAGLTDFVRSEFFGFGAEPYLGQLQHSTSTAIFTVPEGTLAVKHGILAKGMMHEFMSKPVPDRRWYLDLDAWSDLSMPFDDHSLTKTASALTGRICAFFRWAMTNQFMDTYRASDADA